MGKFKGAHQSSVALPLLSVILLQVLFIIPSNIIQAAPTASSSSSQECPIFCRASQNSGLQYDLGVYKYNYQSDIKNEVILSHPESRTTVVSALVELNVISPCDFLLTIKKAKVKTATGNVEATDLDGSSVRFTLEDGIINQVCVTKNDPTWSANIKRSIISLLQNKALHGVSGNDIVESDVSGRCPTRYTITNGNYVKTKNLNSCNHRQGGKTVSRGVPYDTSSVLNSDPYIKSRQECEQTLEGGIVKQVNCTETHISDDLTQEEGTMKTSITVTLNHVGSKKGAPKKALPQNLVKSSIFFDHTDTSTATRQTETENAVRSILERLCDNIQPDGLTSAVPDLLLSVKKAFAHLNTESAVKIYGEIQSGSLCQAQQAKFRKLYLDAAAFSGSDGAIGLLSQLYKSGDLDKVSKRYFYLYTTFAPKPSQSALESVLPLIQGGNGADVSKRLLLAVSGLAHQYCKISNANCLQDGAYAAIVDRLAEIAQGNCQVNDEDRLRVAIAALNALGNTDHLTEKAVIAISTCLGSGSSDRIQVQALDAFRRDPCEARLKTLAQNIFADKSEPSNVRISAFLANLQCLQPNDARVIQKVLDDEESIQVGGFVHSQLRNLLKSSSPSTATLKSAARQLNHNLRYPVEPRKFSRNYESSLYLPNANLGYSAQGNVLFSKESFIPRQASANVTLDIYGQSYNILQVGVYLENFDAIQESIFGPHGEFPGDEEIHSKDVINQILKRARGSRSRRAIPGPVTLNKSGLEALQQKSKIQPSQNAPGIGDAFIRVFGTTVGVLSLNTERVPQVASNVRSKLETFVKGTLQSSTRDINFVQPILFLNLETHSPTIAGFALSETVEGAATPSIKYKKDYKSPSDNNGNTDLNLQLETDLSASLRARTSLVAGPFENGLELDVSFRSGDAFNFQTHREPGKKFEAKVSFPYETVDRLEFTTNVIWTDQAPGRPEMKSDFRPSLQVMPPAESCDEGPINQLLGTVLGLKLCTSTNIHLGKESLFSGKQYLRAKIQKVQPSMEGYSVLFEKQKSGDERNYKVTLDTPGVADRKIELLGHSVDDADGKRKLEVELKTPSKAVSAKFEYERTNSEAEKGIKAKLILPTATVSVQGQVKINRKSGNEVTYEPLLALEYPGKREGSVSTLKFLSGEITRVKGKSLHFDLAHQLPEFLEISALDLFLKGDIKVEREAPDFKYNLDKIQVGVRTRGKDGEPVPVLVLNGKAERQGAKYESDIDVKYGMELEHHLTLHKIALREPGHVKLETKVTSTRVFFLNFDLKADIARDKNAGTYRSLYSLTFGPNDRPQWTLASKTNVAATSKQNFDAENAITFKFPVRNDPSEAIDITVKSHVKNVVGSEQLVDLQYLSGEKGDKGKIVIYFNRKADSNNDFQLRVAVNCHNVNGELTHKRTTVENAPKGYTSSFRHETSLSSPSLNGETTVLTVVNLLNKEGKRGINLESTVTLATGNKLSLTTTLKALPDKYAADLRVTVDGKELALLESSVSGAALSPRIQIKSVVDNVWDITLSREPQAESVVTKLDANIIAAERRVTLDVDRRREGDVCKLDADLKWDAGRDPSQSIQVHSVTSVRKGSILIDSKNEITVIGKKVQVNVDANIPTDIKHGEHTVTLTLVSSDNRNFVIEYKNDLDVNPNSRKSQGQLSLNLPTTRIPADQQQQLVKWNLASLNPNLPRLIFDVSAAVEVTSGGQKTVTTNVHLASNKENDRRSLRAKVDVNVNSENHGVDAELTVGPKYFKTKVSSSCQGRDMTAELEADLTKSTETRRIRTVKYLLVNPPLIKVQRIEGNIAEDFEYNNIRSFGITKKHELSLDGKHAFNYQYRVGLKRGQLKAEGLLNVKSSLVLKFDLSGTLNSDLVDVKGNLQHSGDKTLQVIVKVDRTNPLKHFEVSAQGTNHGILINLQHPTETTATFKHTLRYLNLDGKKRQVEVDFSLDNTNKAVSFALLSSGDDREDSKINVQLDKQGSDTYKFNVEVNIRGKSVSADGSVKRAAGVFEGSTNVNALGKKGSAEIKINIDDKQRKFSIQGGPEGQVQNILTLEYTKEAHGTSKGYEGKISTEIPSFFIEEVQGALTGSFKAEIISYNLQQQGKQLTAHVDFTLPGVLNKGTTEIDLLLTNLEFRSYGLISYQKNSDPEKFRSLDINLKRESASIYTLLKVLRKNNLNSDGQNRTYGLVSETKGTSADWDHTTKLVVGNENSNSLSVHVYGKSQNGGEGDCEGGLELNLPKRTISVEAQKKGGREVQVSAWLDKKNHPEQKLNLAVEYQKLRNEDGAQGYSYKATLTHPTLAKALIINRRVVRFGELTLHESTTELDVFENSANKIIIEALAKYTDSSKQQLQTKLSIKSDGLGLFVDGKGDIKLEPGNPAVANLQYSFKNRNGELKSRNVEIVCGREHQSVLIGDRSNPELLISRSTRHPEHRRRRSTTSDDTIDVRYEIHLPGMSDTRVVDVHLHPSNPPHLDIKTFTGEVGKSYELSVGYPNERQLLIGVYRTLNNEPSKLAELSVALNTTRLLSVKVKWSRTVIREVLKTAADRFGNTGEGVQSVSEEYAGELSADIQQTLGKLADALPRLGPLREHVRTELDEIKSEWESDPETQALTEAVRVLIESAAKPIQELLDCLAQLPENLKKAAQNNPALVKAYDNLRKSLRQIRLRVMKRFFQAILAVREAINRSSSQVQEDLNSTSENAIRKAKTAADTALAKIVEALLSRVDEITRILDESGASPEVKELIQSILKYLLAKAKGEAVEDGATPQEILEMARVAVKKALGEILTVDIENGVISALIPLPRPVNSLLDVRSSIRNALTSKAKIYYRNRLVSRVEVIKQFFRDLARTTPLTAISKALRARAPPHSARAVITGSQYFQTFDGKLFHFEGQCQYLLFADFDHRDVALAINFVNDNGVIKKSLILTDEDQSVVIKPDFSVSQTGEGREGHHIRHEESADTVTLSLEHDELVVSCNKALDVCTVDLNNGYYFGRVAGLLGTYNNEQYDDLRTPEGNPTTSTEAFVESWKLNQCTESPVPPHASASSEAQSLCSSAFSSRWSPLSSCYKVSDPSEYLHICEDLSRENGWTANRAVCATALVYEKTCTGISLGKLSVCTNEV